MKIILKIILGMVFIPLIISFSMAPFILIISDIISAIISLGMDILIIWGYIKLNKKIDNIQFEKAKNILIEKISNRKKSNQEIMIQGDYRKIAENFYVNNREKNIILNGIYIAFDEILSAEIKENEFEKDVVSGIKNNNNDNSFRNNYWY